MRLGSGKSEMENKKIVEFSRWVLDVGDGKVENIHHDQAFSDPEIFIRRQYLIENYINPVKSIVDVIYPDFVNKMNSQSYLREREILTPTNAIVDGINSHVLDLIPVTINKSQGQSLDKVGLFLPQPVFSHGQLYVAVSRVKSPDDLHILIEGDTGRSNHFTANVVFDEVFYNLPVIDS